MEITIIRHDISQFEAKLAEELKKRGQNVSCITLFKPKKEFEGFFEKTNFVFDEEFNVVSTGKKIRLIFKYLLHLPKYLLNILKTKDNILIGISEPNLFISFVFLFLGLRNTKIYYPYDITFFRYKNYKKNFWYNYMPESFNFRFSDAIIHKGPIDELSSLPNSYFVKNKPHLQFLPYCNKERMIDTKNNKIKKISEKQKGTHLVYVGGVTYNNSFIDTFKRIVDQGLFLHLYPTNYSDLINDEEFMELCKKEFFVLHKPIYGKNLQREIAKYDWGLYIIYYKPEISKLWSATMFGNKVSDYLEAGLPIIANSDMQFVSTILKEYNFGVVVKNPEEIKSTISKIDYDKFIEQLDYNRGKFTFEKKH